MEDMKFSNRLEQVQWYEQQQGWGPLTDEDKQALDEAVRMVTNLWYIMRVLLDTHIFIWYAKEQDKLSKDVQNFS